MSNRKIFVVDTSVLLYDMKSIHSFEGNTVVIPVMVLDELDRFKDKQSLLGTSARYVNRFLDELRSYGNLEKGVNISNLPNLEVDQEVRVDLSETLPDSYPKSWKVDRGDNMILACALNVKASNPGEIVKIVTKDINLRVKADSLGIPAEDYLADHIDVSKSEMYTGIENIELTKEEVDDAYSLGNIESFDDEVLPNQGVVGKSPEGGSVLLVSKGNHLVRLETDFPGLGSVKPRNKEQEFAVNMLMDSTIPLVSINGIAGSGKTFLTLVCAMAQIFTGEYKQIVITRSIQPVGKDLGFLPGDMMEKMNPWLAPITDNFRHAFRDKDRSYFDTMIHKGTIEVAPLSYIRGRTF